MKKAIEQGALDFLTGPYESEGPRGPALYVSPPAYPALELTPIAVVHAQERQTREARISDCIALERHVRGAMGDCLNCSLPMLEPGDRRCSRCFEWGQVLPLTESTSVCVSCLALATATEADDV